VGRLDRREAYCGAAASSRESEASACSDAADRATLGAFTTSCAPFECDAIGLR
jgi:hypothetical protein